jgi:hypothetical protein
MRSLAWGVALMLAGHASASAGGEQSAPEPSLDRLAWLAGCWGSSSEDGTTEECWLAPMGGLMLGVHRDVAPSGEAFFEFLRIESSEVGPLYLASPGGRSATPFPLVSLRGKTAVFENREHDFPQRLLYRLMGDGRLRVRAEGPSEGDTKVLQWTWRRQPGSEGGW